jgi:hypothetical protein
MKKYELIFAMLEADTDMLKEKIKECLMAIGCKDNLLVTDFESKMSYLYIRMMSNEEDVKTISSFFKVELNIVFSISFVIENDEAKEQKVEFGSLEEKKLIEFIIKKMIRLRKKAGETWQSIIV